MAANRSKVSDVFGPGPLRSFPTISAEALKKGEESLGAQAPVKAIESAPEPVGKRFIRLPFGSKAAGRRTSRKLGNKFNRCVKSVRSTVKARKGSNKESAAIAICTTSVLYPRGRTMKRYRKKRLITQKKFRGGTWGACS